MKKRIIGIVALIVLFVEYLLLRYPLFYLHRMKEWPLDLVAAALVISGIAVWVRNSTVPVCTAIGYAVGFLAGYFFQTTDSIKGTNNLWIVWTITMIGFILLGVILNMIIAKHRKGETPTA